MEEEENLKEKWKEKQRKVKKKVEASGKRLLEVNFLRLRKRNAIEIFEIFRTFAFFFNFAIFKKKFKNFF